MLSLWDIIEAGIIDPIQKVIASFTPAPTQRDYALAGFKTGSEFVAEEEHKTKSQQMAQELLDEMLAEDAAMEAMETIESCKVCGNEVKVMCLVGTGVCSILCEKVAKNEVSVETREKIREGMTIESGIK